MCICISACIYTHTYAKSKCVCVYKCSICTLVEYYGENMEGKPYRISYISVNGTF